MAWFEARDRLALIQEQVSGLSDLELLLLLPTLADQNGQIQERVEQVLERTGNLPNLTLLLLLFGIEAEEVGLPADPDLPPFSAIEGISDLYQKLAANQESVDSFFDVFVELDLGNAIESRASQESVDSFFDVFTELDSLEAKVTELDGVLLYWRVP